MPLLALVSSLVWSQEKAEFASGSSIVRRVQGGFRECRGQLGSDREEKNPLGVQLLCDTNPRSEIPAAHPSHMDQCSAFQFVKPFAT